MGTHFDPFPAGSQAAAALAASENPFGTYRGTHVTDGSVRTWRGTFGNAGGNGRYEKATGGCDCKGRADPGAFEECGSGTRAPPGREGAAERRPKELEWLRAT